jgi:predicted nucleic acid-binding protein
MRVVLDTNVVLSALVFGGSTAGRLRLAWQQGVFVPLASTATAQELLRVLAYPKFRLSAQEQDELLADYLPYTRTVRIPRPPPEGLAFHAPGGGRPRAGAGIGRPGFAGTGRRV